MTCNQVEFGVLTEELNAAHETLSKAFPWLNDSDIVVEENKSRGCVYNHNGYNCDVYTDGALYPSRTGKLCKDFSFVFVLDRDDENRVNHIELVIRDYRNYKEVLDPGVLALMA